MTLQERFTDDELLLLNSVPTVIGSAMAFAEGSGLGTIKELMANAKTYIGGSKAYPNNEIITGILPNLEDRKEAVAHAKEFRKKAMARLKDKGINSHETLRNQLIEDCKTVSEILANKASEQEATEYKEWAMSVAENVAKAAKEGGFLGFGGETISEGEKEVFGKIASSLGVSSNLA
ncbi:MAG: hypothetical protein V3U75_12580 [Methylococcaceae bacterium]